MKSLAAVCLFFSTTLVVSSALAKEPAYKRGWGHLCNYLMARAGTGVLFKPEPLVTKDGISRVNFDGEINDFLTREWVPDSYSSTPIRVQMQYAAATYGALRVENFSMEIAKLAAIHDYFGDDISNLRNANFSDNQIQAALEVTSRLADLAKVVKKTKWSIDSSIALFKRHSEISKRFYDISREVHAVDSKLTDLEKQNLHGELSEVIALQTNLYTSNLIRFAELGFSAERSLELCELLAKQYPKTGASASGYLLFYKNGFAHDDALVLASVEERDLALVLALRDLNFATKDTIKILQGVYTRRFAQLVYIKARAIGHSEAEAHDIATNHTSEFLRWQLEQGVETLPEDLRFKISVPESKKPE